LGQILVLRDTMSFYARDVSAAIQERFQGYAHVMDWEKAPRGVRPEDFWKRFWTKAGSKYDLVVVLGPKSLKFAMENVKDRPVIYLENYHRLSEAPPNFAGVYVAMDYYLQIARLVCSVEEAKVLGILAHNDDWGLLSKVFTDTNPGISEIHIRFIRHPSQVVEALEDLRAVGVRVVWVPSSSQINGGRYLRNLLKRSPKERIGVVLDRVSKVRQGALAAWEPRYKDVGDVLASLIGEILESSKSYVQVLKDSSGAVKGKVINWKAFLRPHYLRFVKSPSLGRSAFNLTLSKKLGLHVVKECIDRFDEKY